MKLPVLSFAALLAMSVSLAHAQAPKVERIDIVEYGLYSTRVVEEIKDEKLVAGTRRRLADAKLIEATTVVPCKLGTKFGFRFVVVGEPSGADVKLRFVCRFPESGLHNPETGKTSLQDEFEQAVKIGSKVYREMEISKAWGLVPGTWSFEVWHEARKLAEKKFTVVTP